MHFFFLIFNFYGVVSLHAKKLISIVSTFIDLFVNECLVNRIMVWWSSFQVAYVVSWTKQGSMLPPGASDFMGVLTINNVRLEDSGRYICTGSNMHEIAREYATLTVTST